MTTVAPACQPRFSLPSSSTQAMLESADSNSICPVGAPRTESGIVTGQPVSDTFTVLGKTSQ
ncbi:MAG: hypothetical protein MZV70_52170 [Desulfobacterales bacterium]|nr:hypothetical protein [Desulfobacterales bacterium]